MKYLLKPKWIRTALLACVIASFLGVESVLLRDKSATYDEAVILLSGYEILLTGYDLINPENPPLAKSLMALPGLLLGLELELPKEIIVWRESYQMGPRFKIGREFLHKDTVHHSLLFYGRAVNVILAALAGLVLFFTIRLYASFHWALLGTTLFLFCPSVMAHAALATVDVPAALFILLANYCVLRQIDKPSIVWPLCAGLAAGCAMLSKMTGTLVLPLLAVQMLVYWVASPSWARLLSAARFIIMATIVAIAAVGCTYGFAGFGVSWAGLEPESRICKALASIPILGSLPLPLPGAYLRGFDLAAFFNQPGCPQVFMGQYFPAGGSWWYYYIFTLAVKLPLPLIVLMTAGSVYCWVFLRRRLMLHIHLVIPCLLMMNFSFLAYRQLGVRYVMPVLPFLVILAVLGARWLWKRPGAFSKTVAALLVAICLADSLRIVPDSLAYCNQLVGGPAKACEWVADSDLDWGQDLPALRRWLDANGDPPVHLFYFGTASPEFHGINSSLDAEVVAISVTSMYLYSKDDFFQKILSEPPIDSVGYSIYIYKVQPWLRTVFEETKAKLPKRQ